VGCGSGSKATLTANWSLKKADGTSDACLTNYNKVKVVAQGYTKGLDSHSGEPIVQVFDCQAGTGTLSLQTSGDAPASNATDLSGIYDVTVTITEATGETDYVPTTIQKVALSGATRRCRSPSIPMRASATSSGAWSPTPPGTI
jgi:hypothetical protein